MREVADVVGNASGRLVYLKGCAWVLAMLLGAVAITARIPAAEPDQASQETFIHTAPSEVWRLLTTTEGLRKLTGAAAESDLRIGGFLKIPVADSTSVTAVHEILAYEPQRMLILRPQQVQSDGPLGLSIPPHCWTVIYLTPAGDATTQVRLVLVNGGEHPIDTAAREWLLDQYQALIAAIAKQHWPKCAKCEADESAA